MLVQKDDFLLQKMLLLKRLCLFFLKDLIITYLVIDHCLTGYGLVKAFIGMMRIICSS